MSTKKMVKKEDTLPVAAGAYSEYANRGFQNVTQDDIAIPFLNILQKGSPEVDKDDPKFVEGAKPGMFYNTVTGQLFETVRFVPAITQHMYIEWTPRDEGGGIVNRHATQSNIVRQAKAASTEFGKYKVGNNDLVETYYMFGILSDEDGSPMGPALVSFTSTKITPYKRFMGRINGFQLVMTDDNGNVINRVTPPLFAHEVLLSTKLRQSTKGNAYVPVLEPAVENDVEKSLLSPSDPRFQAAAKIEQLVDEGRAHADESTQAEATASADDKDETLPF